jgi:hypothetical protein
MLPAAASAQQKPMPVVGELRAAANPKTIAP